MKNNKSLGQHWLKNRQILDEIASLAAGEGENSGFCLEIGPGLGTLTSSLLRRFGAVMAIEYDSNLAYNLPKSFPGKNLKVIHQNFLDFDLSALPPRYIVAGNIPYYITSPIIEKLLSSPNLPARIVLLIQKEVAERIVAEQGSHTLLSLSVQNRAFASLGPLVPRDEFTPPPKVDSQVIILDPRPEPIIPPEIFPFIKIGFSSPRKKLISNLSAGLKLERAQLQEAFQAVGLSIDLRPADLCHQDWFQLRQRLKNTHV